MKKFLGIALLWAALLPAASFATPITGDVTGGGSFNGTVTQSGAWASSSVTEADHVNFWSLTGSAGDLLSITVTSAMIDFGISVYAGLIDDFDVFSGSFLNDASFGGNTFIGGTNPVASSGPASLSNLLLPTNGFYTIAVGGMEFPDAPGRYGYNLSVVHAVPLPETTWLLLSGFAGLAMLRRRRPRAANPV